MRDAQGPDGGLIHQPSAALWNGRNSTTSDPGVTVITVRLLTTSQGTTLRAYTLGRRSRRHRLGGLWDRYCTGSALYPRSAERAMVITADHNLLALRTGSNPRCGLRRGGNRWDYRLTSCTATISGVRRASIGSRRRRCNGRLWAGVYWQWWGRVIEEGH